MALSFLLAGLLVGLFILILFANLFVIHLLELLESQVPELLTAKWFVVALVFVTFYFVV